MIILKFSTWYTTVLKNKFREETESLNYDKRKVVFFSESYNRLLESGFDIEDTSFNFNNIVDNINISNLSADEKLFCDLIANYNSSIDIMEIMNINQNKYYYLKNKLKKKLIIT